jgi:hypothetical protein
MLFTSLTEKTSDKVYFVAAIGFFVLAPNMVARVIMQLALAYFPTWAQLIVVTVLFALLLFWAWLISGNRGVRSFTQLYKRGAKWPVLLSIAMFAFALVPFAALSSILADRGRAIFDPAVPKGEFWRLQDLYLWHFLNSVPSLKIPETLLWPEPFRYKDHLSGVLLLAFKIIVIVPVIASFSVWARVSKDEPANQSPE